MSNTEIPERFYSDEIVSPYDRIDRSNKDIPIQSIIEYRNKGLSLGEIAKLTGCSKQNIHQRLESVGYDKENLEYFKKHRGDVFAFIQSRLLNSIDDETIKGMNAYQRIIGASIMYDKERLETGKSTANISVFAHIVDMAGKRSKQCPETPKRENGQFKTCSAWAVEFRNTDGKWVSLVYSDVRTRSDAERRLSLLITDRERGVLSPTHEESHSYVSRVLQGVFGVS